MSARVLVFSHLFPLEPESAQGRFVEDQVKALIDAGLVLNVVTVRFAPLRLSKPHEFLRAVFKGIILGQTVHKTTERGVPFTELQCPGPRLGGGIQALIYAACALRARRSIEGAGPFQIVHAHTGLLDGVAAMIFSRALDLPFVLTEHTGPYISLMKGTGARWLTKRVLSRADSVIAVSRALRSEMIRCFPDLSLAIRVIPNTFFAEKFCFKRQTQRPIACGWLGYITPVKRIDRLLDAFHNVKVSFPEARLKIITMSAAPDLFMRKARELAIETLIDFVPANSRETVADALRELSVLFVTSETETFSVACLEALAVGTPVVSTNCGGPSDLISSELEGIVIDAKDPMDLATAAIAILRGDQNTPSAREARAKRTVQRFGPSLIVESYRAIYRETINRSKK